MFNLIANIVSWILIILMLTFSAFFDRKNVKNPSIFLLCILAIIVAISVLLTNLISYNLAIFGETVQLNFGQFLIFISGMLFGPFYGIVSGICGDTLGAMFNIAGAYSSIFTLDQAISGFAGSLVFMFKNNKLWYLKMMVIYCMQFAIASFINDEIWLLVTFGQGYALSALLVKLIKFPIECFIYTNLIAIVFPALFKLLETSSFGNYWCYKNGTSNLISNPFNKKIKPKQI